MSYFNKFPLIKYSFDNGETTKVAVDILKRIGIKENIKNTAELFERHTIRDGETPDMLADRFYGDSNLHWLIMIMNDIINPYEDWPVSTRVLNKRNNQVKYPGAALMLTGHTGTGDVANINFTKDDQIYGIEGNTFSVDSSGSVDSLDTNGVAGIIHRWDRTFQKLEVVGISGSFLVGDYITSIGVDDGSYIYTVGRIGRVVQQNSDAVHHFTDSDDNFINPYATPPSSEIGEQIVVGQTGSGYTGAVVYGDTVLQNYIVDSTDTYTTTNNKYEEDVNESKRSIMLLQSEYVIAVVQEFERVIGGR